MGALQNTVFFIIFIGVLITVHELGHFLAAKWAGVRVLKFSIGFGPKLFSVRRGDTEYQIAALPLGGFVQMAGALPGEEVDEADAGRTFLGAPWWKRIVISFAGPAFNLIFPIFAYFFVFVGDQQVSAPRVGWVEPNYPAAIAGVEPGDLVKAIDGKRIRSFEEISPALEGIYERPVAVTVERDGKELTLQISPLQNEVATNAFEKVRRGLLGISRQAQPAIIGVPDERSPAFAAGLRTFDRIVSVNGEPVADDVKLARLLDRLEGPLTVVVVRSVPKDVGGAALIDPSLVTVSLDKQPGRGLAALGVESGNVYAWFVFPNSPAAKAGIKVGDRLVSMGGAPLTSWYTVQQALRAADRGPFEVTWRSGGQTQTKQVTQVAEEKLDEMKNKLESLEFGVRPRASFIAPASELLDGGGELELVTVHMGVVDAFGAALREVPKAIRVIAMALGKLATRQISSENLGGPIALFRVASLSAEAGYQMFLAQMAIVSVNLGLINLLPIPILDGFTILAALWEGIRRRPIPDRAREVANMVGFAMLAMLVVLVFTNDITKLFR